MLQLELVSAPTLFGIQSNLVAQRCDIQHNCNQIFIRNCKIIANILVLDHRELIKQNLVSCGFMVTLFNICRNSTRVIVSSGANSFLSLSMIRNAFPFGQSASYVVYNALTPAEFVKTSDNIAIAISLHLMADLASTPAGLLGSEITEYSLSGNAISSEPLTVRGPSWYHQVPPAMLMPGLGAHSFLLKSDWKCF
jgi:hypothetical protein